MLHNVQGFHTMYVGLAFVLSFFVLAARGVDLCQLMALCIAYHVRWKWESSIIFWTTIPTVKTHILIVETSSKCNH